MAWSVNEMVQFFNRHVLPTLCPGIEATAVTIEDMTYFAGRKCDILYSLQLGSPSRDESVWAVVTFTKDNRAQRIYARCYGGDVVTSAQTAPPPAVSLPEYRCLVELFPSDW